MICIAEQCDPGIVWEGRFPSADSCLGQTFRLEISSRKLEGREA
ncbi:hypothetical protein RSSM_05356 [Rhodopirellula sallentina SM41]|uniref:Uncharacterized protein n=1 Tax=Rhodopirellula sallentina SM41 TaxID=1263870 RepID=M5UB51_9BACT|nr:hypothetical protein RSSM_05356 [Rhodopirellula sallentina SM41]